MRLIDADALFSPDENSDKVLVLGGRCGGGKTVALAIELLKKKVKDAPTINPEDCRPHGRWEFNTDNFTPAYRCSACGYQKPVVAGECVSQGAMNYCPNCGAKMYGKEQGHENT